MVEQISFALESLSEPPNIYLQLQMRLPILRQRWTFQVPEPSRPCLPSASQRTDSVRYSSPTIRDACLPPRQPDSNEFQKSSQGQPWQTCRRVLQNKQDATVEPKVKCITIDKTLMHQSVRLADTIQQACVTSCDGLLHCQTHTCHLHPLAVNSYIHTFSQRRWRLCCHSCFYDAETKEAKGSRDKMGARTTGLTPTKKKRDIQVDNHGPFRA